MCRNPIRGLLYRSAKENGGINLALFVDSEEVEGVASEALAAETTRSG